MRLIYIALFSLFSLATPDQRESTRNGLLSNVLTGRMH